jgi:hypothetical protein
VTFADNYYQMAETEKLEEFGSFVMAQERFADDTSIRQGSIPEYSFAKSMSISQEFGSRINKRKTNRPSEISINQVGIFPASMMQNRILENRITQDSSIKDTTSEIGFFKPNTLQHSSSQIGTSQVSFSHIGKQNGSDQTSLTQISSMKGATLQISSHQIDFTQVSIFQNTVPVVETDKGKIPFSNSVTSEQFFSSYLLSSTNHAHNSTPQIINDLNNTATNIWSDLLRERELAALRMMG